MFTATRGSIAVRYVAFPLFFCSVGGCKDTSSRWQVLSSRGPSCWDEAREALHGHIISQSHNMRASPRLQQFLHAGSDRRAYPVGKENKSIYLHVYIVIICIPIYTVYTCHIMYHTSMHLLTDTDTPIVQLDARFGP